MECRQSEAADLESARAIGQRVGVSAHTIKLWARRGWIPCVRITGKVVRFEWRRVLAALRERGMATLEAGGQ